MLSLRSLISAPFENAVMTMGILILITEYDVVCCITDDHSYDSDSDSSIEVIGQWQESQIDHCDEKGIDGYSYDYDSDDDNDSIVGLDVARQLDQVTELALKRRMEVSELLAAVLEQNRRLKALASSYEPVNGKLDTQFFG
jgi:hypothetical protein